MKYPDPSRQAEPKAVIKITPRISRESELNNVFAPGTDQPFRESRHVYDGCGNPVEVVISTPRNRSLSKETSTYEYSAYGHWMSLTTIQSCSFLDKQGPDMQALTWRIILYYPSTTETTDASNCVQQYTHLLDSQRQTRAAPPPLHAVWRDSVRRYDEDVAYGPPFGPTPTQGSGPV